jgi:hypothetical protein
MSTSSAQLGYIAGFLDGEGHITIRRCNATRSITPSYQPVVGFTNRDLRPLQLIHQLFGGKIYQKARKLPQHRPAFELTIFRRAETKALLEALLPHLIMKREQADLALRLLSLGKIRKEMVQARGKTWPLFRSLPSDVADREEIRQRMQIINGRGGQALAG